MASPQNLNPTKEESLYNEEPSSLIIIVSGMGVMMLLVAIAILLLLCSHLKYMQEQHRQREEALRRRGEATVPSVDGSPRLPPHANCSYNDIVLVVFPGGKNPSALAHPCPKD